MPESIVFNMDCIDGMKNTPDKYYDLSIVDPPYGIGEGNKKNKTGSSFTGFGGNRKWVNAKDYGGGEFDSSIPSVNYFIELQRVSRNQIIWGGNYMIEHLTNTTCFVVWDKDNGNCDQADCEIAWTSFTTAIRKFKFRWHGLLQQNMKNKEQRIHPTQKPIALYKWLLQNYAKAGNKILDTHLGSGSSRIAAYDMGFDFTGYELDTDYYLAQEKRFKNHIAQQSLFVPEKKVIIEQKPLF